MSFLTTRSLQLRQSCAVARARNTLVVANRFRGWRWGRHDVRVPMMPAESTRSWPRNLAEDEAFINGWVTPSSANVTFPVYFGDMTTLSPAVMIRETPEKTFVHVNRLPGSSTAARKAASRAVKEGLLLPVRRGLYYRGPRTRYGMVAPRPEEVARVVLGTRGTGPAGYSAARAWGLTTQVPPLWHVATLRTVDPIDGVVQHDRKNLARTDLNEKEIALLELLRSPEVYVEAGWDALVDKVRASLRAGEVSAERLREAVPGEYNRAVRDNFARLDENLA